MAKSVRRSILPLAAFGLFVAGLNCFSFAAAAIHLQSTVSSQGQMLAADKGKFRDMVNGRRVGSESFEIVPDGQGYTARATAEVQAEKGPATHITSLLQLRADGAPLHYEWSMDGPKKVSSSIDFNGGTATIQLQIPGKNPFTQQLLFKTPRVAVLDDNLYFQYSVLANLYDWSKKGPQDIPVLIPQEMTPGSVTVEALGPEDSGGKSLARLRVHSQDLDLTLYFDGNRLVRIAVPGSNAEIVRE